MVAVAHSFGDMEPNTPSEESCEETAGPLEVAKDFHADRKSTTGMKIKPLPYWALFR